MSGVEPFFLSALGGVVSAVGAIQQGRANEQAAVYNAESARIEAQSRERAQRAESERRMGTLRANIGKSGATSAGTPLMVLAESAANAEIDALNTLYTGQRQSDLYRMQGANARRAGNIAAGTSLLTTAGRIF